VKDLSKAMSSGQTHATTPQRSQHFGTSDLPEPFIVTADFVGLQERRIRAAPAVGIAVHQKWAFAGAGRAPIA